MIAQLGRDLRRGRISSIELVQQTAAALKSDPFNCLITLTEEQALAEAVERDKELAAGMDRGPLHGIVVAHKDLFYTRGVRTTAGSLVYRDFIPTFNATVIDKLQIAGAICIGKANQHELAYGVTSKNQHHGFVLNPRDPRRIPGGSSGGSAAAIAAGYVPMSLGSDTGGSIRIPAAYCGVTGLKPTYGRVSRHGVLPLSYSLDHVGPLGASVQDCALTMNVISGADGKDETCVNLPRTDFNLPSLPHLKGLRVGVPQNFFFEAVDAEVSSTVMKAVKALERLGATVLDITIPNPAELNIVARIIQLAEVSSVYASYRDPQLFSRDTWTLLEQGRLVQGHEYVTAQRLRRRFREQFDALWRKVDLLATPTTPIVAPLLEETKVMISGTEEDTRMASTRLVRAINLIGEPALSMPCGYNSSGLPIGLQLISPPFTEPELLQVAKTLEPVLGIVS